MIRGFRFCSIQNKFTTGNCYLIDSDVFKEKVNPNKFFQLRQNEINRFENGNSSDKNPDDEKKKLQDCVLMKKLDDKFVLPLIKKLSKLEDEIKKGKFNVTFKNEGEKDDDDDEKKNEDDKKDDLKRKQPIILNFKTISFRPNEKLFPVEKQSNAFEIINSNMEIKSSFLIEESDSKTSTLRTLNDCYLHCLNSNTEDVICHSFAFCYDQLKSIAKCQLSHLHFNDLIEGDEGYNYLKNNENTDYSNWLQKAACCNVYNLLFKNYFKQTNDKMIEEYYAFETLEDNTLEECLEQCYAYTKSNQSIEDETVCRLVEYCTDNEIVENKKKSYCLMTNEDVENLPEKEIRKGRSCQLYDCK